MGKCVCVRAVYKNIMMDKCLVIRIVTFLYTFVNKFLGQFLSMKLKRREKNCFRRRRKKEE